MIPKGYQLDRIKMTPAQRRTLLRLSEVQEETERRAKLVGDAAGGTSGGYEVASSRGKTRARAAVFAAGGRARRDNAKNNTLLRALDAGRR